MSTKAHADATLPPEAGSRHEPSSSVYAQVAALLHDSRQHAPDQLGSFLRTSVRRFGIQDLTVYVTDFQQRSLVPIPGSAEDTGFPIDGSVGGRAFTTATQVTEPLAGGATRLWSVVVDGAARLGVMSTTMPRLDDSARELADSLAGVVAALLVTRGQCTDAYTTIRRSQELSLAAEMQWDLLPPLSLDSGRVSIAGLIQPAYEVGGDSFDYAVNGDTLHFAVFDAVGHGLVSSQLAHLAVSSYRHSRRSQLDLAATYHAIDQAVASQGSVENYVTCMLATLDLGTGTLRWINAGHPAPILVRGPHDATALVCAPTVPAGLSKITENGVVEVASLALESGDRLFCLTDGVVDSHRRGGSDFGEDRLLAWLRDRSHGRLDAAETVRRLSHSVLEHHGMLSDDTTAFLVDLH